MLIRLRLAAMNRFVEIVYIATNRALAIAGDLADPAWLREALGYSKTSSANPSAFTDGTRFALEFTGAR